MYSTASNSDFGSLLQLRNLINRRNVTSNPGRDVNAADDFFTLVVTTHFLACAMKKLDIKSLNDVPNMEQFNANSWMATDADRRSSLNSFCHELINEHVMFSLSYEGSTCSDGVLNYANEIMSLGIFYMNFKDAIREGDGDRILMCWKYLLPLFRVSNRRNYSFEVFSMLYSYYYTLSPRQSQQLLWSRSVNIHGQQGRNVSCDLHMEHLNRVCKEAIKGVGANKTSKTIQRVGKVVGVLAETKNFDESVLHHDRYHGTHKASSSAKDQQIILDELLNRACVFEEQANRVHTNFTDFSKKPSLFMKIKMKELETWIKDHISKKY